MQRRTLLKAFALSASVVAMGMSFGLQAADTIKVGIMHSLSGTMAISELTRSTPKGAYWGKNWSRWWWIPLQTGRCLPRKRASC